MRRVSRLHWLVPVIIGVVAVIDASLAVPPGGVDESAAAVVERAVAQACRAPVDRAATLLPPGTKPDRVEWRGNVIHVHLTVYTAPGTWKITPLQAEAISDALAAPFRADPRFGGIVVRAREVVDRPYDTLEQFMPGNSSRSSPDAAQEPAEMPTPIGRTATAVPRIEASLGGPVVNADRQPTGALSGVTVFASAGHGWTADNVDDGNPLDFTWYLQRPVLLDMAEDYGNIDQLNYFVHYAFNAGATVVPFRPVGWQDIEIVLDNDDPGVTYTGSWSDGSSSKYYENNATVSGIVYKWTSADTSETATARYTPAITVTDSYPVYCFSIANTNRTLQTYRIAHNGGVTEVPVDHRAVGNGWIWLGEYYFEAGGDNYVEITNKSPEAGAIIADAVRWGNGMGDIVRPGPGTVSGYPRDEEAQRYWAHSELGNNATGFDSDIWNGGGDDQGDNVRTGGKWAREMNQVPAGGVQVDRWKRVHLEFHTNAFNGGARGCIALITDLGATTYQEQYATFMADEIDVDMLIMDDEFEHTWYDRASPTYTSSYGAICTGANSDEFDATIIELAYHDNQQDAELLRDSRVRSAMARSSVQGIIRFLNWLPDSPVPLAFAPDVPGDVQAEDAGNGDVVLSWVAPPSDDARGDPATGYVVYQSTNGYGFGSPITTNGLCMTVSDVPVGETRYYRIAATNAGGESMPSEVLAVRRPAEGTANVLIVNGFDRLCRQQNPVQTFTQPPAYAGEWIERQIWRRSNSFNYVIQHAEALSAATTNGFGSCANESVIDGTISLDDYDIVVWICGEESTEDSTFDATEQAIVTSFLENGGALFVSGSQIAYDLDDQNNGRSFYEDTLGSDFVSDDAGTYGAAGATGGILSDVGTFNFDPANGAPYDVDGPDRLSPQPDAVEVLTYVGGTGGTAGVQYDACVYRVVTFGFPFEAITSAGARADIMQRVIDYLENTIGVLPFDTDQNCRIDLEDYNILAWCLQGPSYTFPNEHFCLIVDGNEDNRVDLTDFALFQQVFTGAP